jgi:hypothetical protein
MYPAGARRALSRLAVGLLAMALAAAAPPVAAQEDLQARIKAAYLFNFARFVTWPAHRLSGPTDPLRICIYGSNRLAETVMETVEGKTIGEHPIETLATPRIEDLRRCHIVYLDEAASGAAVEILRQLSGSGVLTVHEAARPLRDGIVRFFIEDRKVRFEINTRTATRENLQLSAKLLGVARLVQE